MKIIKHVLFVLVLVVLTGLSSSSSVIKQSNDDGYSVENFYKKIDLDYGTLDKNGLNIDYGFSITSIDEGIYEITLADGLGNLYKINGTDLYMTLYSYFGYAGYSINCILKVTYNSTTVI